MEPKPGSVSGNIPPHYFMMVIVEACLFAPFDCEPAIIAGGYVFQGQLAVGDTAQLVGPSGKRYTVTIDSLIRPRYGRVGQIQTGDSAQCRLGGITKDALEPDQVLMKIPPNVRPTVKKVGVDIAVTLES